MSFEDDEYKIVYQTEDEFYDPLITNNVIRTDNLSRSQTSHFWVIISIFFFFTNICMYMLTYIRENIDL